MRASDLTRGEKLFLLRHRSGTTLAEQAADYGISMTQMRDWDRDITSSGQQPPSVGVGKVTRSESFRILRRRSGKTVAQLADELGYCSWWFRKMETGQADDSPLAVYWADAG